jgi:hypothetical protein
MLRLKTQCLPEQQADSLRRSRWRPGKGMEQDRKAALDDEEECHMLTEGKGEEAAWPTHSSVLGKRCSLCV